MHFSRVMRLAGAAFFLGSIVYSCTLRTPAPEDESFQQAIRGKECRAGTTALCATLGDVTAYLPGGHLDLTKPVTVIDPGGPGLDALAQGATTEPFTAIPNAAVILEPWVTGQTSAQCRVAFNTYMTQVRADGDLTRAAEAFTAACSTELNIEAKFAAHGITAAAADLRERGVSQLTFLGVSFGAQRVLAAATTSDHVILVAPFVALRPLAQEVTRRTLRSYRILGLNKSEWSLVERVRTHLPAHLLQRSTPFTRTDLDAALISAAYDPDNAVSLLVHDIRALDTAQQHHTTPQLLWLPKAADYLEGRYRAESYYRGLIGYFGNYCATFAHRPTRQALALHGRFLNRFHVACAHIDLGASRRGVSNATGCMITSHDDPVASSAALVSQAYPNLTPSAVTGRGHATGAELAVGVAIASRLAAGQPLTCRVG